MSTIILKTKDFLYDFALVEVEKFTKKKYKCVSKELIEIDFDRDKELFTFVMNIYYFSRAIESVVLKEFNDEKDIDLIGFNLMNRDFLLNSNSLSVDPSVVIYCLYSLEFDLKRKPFSVLDPYANLGEVLIETAYFKPRNPLHLKKRFSLNLTKYFKFPQMMPKSINVDSNYTGVVLNNNDFKKIKENIAFSNQKVKVSQFDFSWLDVKYKREHFDYVITSFPYFEDEVKFKDFCDKFFYQAEFIAKKGICVISRQKIDLKITRKYRLPLSFKKEMSISNNKYFVYVF